LNIYKPADDILIGTSVLQMQYTISHRTSSVQRTVILRNLSQTKFTSNQVVIHLFLELTRIHIDLQVRSCWPFRTEGCAYTLVSLSQVFEQKTAFLNKLLD